MYDSSRGANIHPRWLNRELHVGDEITIRVLKEATVDRPKSKHITTAAELRKYEWEHYQEMKKKFEPPSRTVTRGRRGPGAGA